MFGKKKDIPTTGPGLAFVITSEGGRPVRLPGVHVAGGVRVVGGREYPNEFLCDLGGSHYQAGTHFEVPADGDYSQLVTRLDADGNEVPVELAVLDAPRFMVYWWQVCAARERQNLDAVFDPPNPQGKTLSLVARCFLIAACVVAIFQTWGLKAASQRIADQATVLAASVERLAPEGGAPSGGAAPSNGGRRPVVQSTPPLNGSALDPVDGEYTQDE